MINFLWKNQGCEKIVYLPFQCERSVRKIEWESCTSSAIQRSCAEHPKPSAGSSHFLLAFLYITAFKILLSWQKTLIYHEKYKSSAGDEEKDLRRSLACFVAYLINNDYSFTRCLGWSDFPSRWLVNTKITGTIFLLAPFAFALSFVSRRVVKRLIAW